MAIRTTINIRHDVYERLSLAANRLNRPRRDVLMAVVMMLMADVERFQRSFRTVRYQPDCPKESWRCYSIVLRPDENEYCVDLRKACKCSVSLIVAMAVETYLDRLMAKGESGMHNYARFSSYVILRTQVDGVICWHYYWGNPYNHHNSLSK